MIVVQCGRVYTTYMDSSIGVCPETRSTGSDIAVDIAAHIAAGIAVDIAADNHGYCRGLIRGHRRGHYCGHCPGHCHAVEIAVGTAKVHLNFHADRECCHGHFHRQPLTLPPTLP